jgi:hypothetical protein
MRSVTKSCQKLVREGDKLPNWRAYAKVIAVGRLRQDMTPELTPGAGTRSVSPWLEDMSILA